MTLEKGSCESNICTGKDNVFLGRNIQPDWDCEAEGDKLAT